MKFELIIGFLLIIVTTFLVLLVDPLTIYQQFIIKACFSVGIAICVANNPAMIYINHSFGKYIVFIIVFLLIYFKSG